MADRFFRRAASAQSAEEEARRATSELFERIGVDRRRQRRRLRSRDLLIDVGVAMATYTGVTVAIVLGAIYGVWTAIGLLIG